MHWVHSCAINLLHFEKLKKKGRWTGHCPFLRRMRPAPVTSNRSSSVSDTPISPPMYRVHYHRVYIDSSGCKMNIVTGQNLSLQDGVLEQLPVDWIRQKTKLTKNVKCSRKISDRMDEIPSRIFLLFHHRFPVSCSLFHIESFHLLTDGYFLDKDDEKWWNDFEIHTQLSVQIYQLLKADDFGDFFCASVKGRTKHVAVVV